MPLRVPVLYGAAGFGNPDKKAHLQEPAECQKMVDLLVSHGQVGIDTGRIYGAGASERVLGRLELKGAKIDTKIFPVTPGSHSPEKLKELFRESLDALGPQKIRIFYLHAPDRSVPFEDTLRVIDELYKQGHFEEFGLSNYNSWEVAEIVGICKSKGWVHPTVYQGVYNCFDRTIETELVPCARKLGLRLAGYSPLAGGFLTGKYLNRAEAQPGSHFDPNWHLSWFYLQRYVPMLPALQEVKDIADKLQLTLGEVAVRWLQHHSVLTPNDLGPVFGANTPEQLETILIDSAKGPLPEEVVVGLEIAWSKVKGGVAHYAL